MNWSFFFMAIWNNSWTVKELSKGSCAHQGALAFFFMGGLIWMEVRFNQFKWRTKCLTLQQKKKKKPYVQENGKKKGVQ